MPVIGQRMDKKSLRLEKMAFKRSDFISGLFVDWKHTGEVKADSIQVSSLQRIVSVYLSAAVTNIPVRTSWVSHLKTETGKGLGHRFREYSIQLFARNRLLEEYIPNYYRVQAGLYDTVRLTKPYHGVPLVIRRDRPGYPGGLDGKHIALWPSHGFFFDQQLDRWQWQRARLWETVEDIFPWTFTTSYLVPMLENAGATVLLPRERDTQIHEVIVDNDRQTGNSKLIITNGNNKWQNAENPGFLKTDTLYQGQNPFRMGTYLMLNTFPGDTASLVYVPDIPETGDYAVYVSWGKTEQCIEKVSYDVRYTGGIARFTVNQCMGAGTWTYLGTFHFNSGMDIPTGSVMISGSETKGFLTADAVRFGGGMGNIVRKPGPLAELKQKSSADGQSAGEALPPDDIYVYNDKISGKPRWMEGSRYYLQYAGMPEDAVYNLNCG